MSDASDDGGSDDNFGGAWLVTEYVFGPDGSFVGTVRQRRLIEPVDDGRLRVTQHCEPSSELVGHAMGSFAGEWVFDLTVDGPHRHYLGPDVVGMGTEWQPGGMTGHGLWPRFGHEFTSYGVLVSHDRQLTGGFFSKAGRSVADIVGVAIPEAAGVEPTLDLSVIPPDLGAEWQVTRTVGPMRIGLSRTADEERRRYRMLDTTADVGITIDTTTTFGAIIGGASTTTEITVAPRQS